MTEASILKRLSMGKYDVAVARDIQFLVNRMRELKSDFSILDSRLESINNDIIHSRNINSMERVWSSIFVFPIETACP